MSRSVPLWTGATDDSPIPDRVRLRVWERAGGHCQSCTRKILAGEKWQCDHKQAVINGGANAEHNLQILCSWCHKRKTRDDVAIKSYHYRRKLAHAGIKRKSRPFPGSRSSPFKKKISGEVVPRFRGNLQVKWR